MLASPNLGCISEIKMKKVLFHFVLSSLNRNVGFAELRMRLNNKNKSHFILYCVRLSLTLATPKLLTLDKPK